tara:strand:- start:6369 stop:8222 length:1854 start_codon:yes stop_codon:yes gene_type:complete
MTLKNILDLPRKKKIVIYTIFDSCFFVLALLLSGFLLEEKITDVFTQNYYFCSIASLITLITGFSKSGIFQITLRHQVGDLITRLVKNCAIASLVIYLADLVFKLSLPGSLPIVFFAFLFIARGAILYSFLSLRGMFLKRQGQQVAIYGAGSTGLKIFKELNSSSKYQPEILIDDSPRVQGLVFNGVEVISFEQAKTMIKKSGIKTVVIAMPKITNKQKNTVYEKIINLGVFAVTSASAADTISGQDSGVTLLPLKPEDFLARNAVEPNEQLMQKNINGKCVLVSGAAGSIGSELCRQIVQLNPKRLLMLDANEYGLYKIDRELNGKNLSFEVTPILGSVNNKNFVEKIFDELSPDTILHAAAYKHVPLLEANKLQSIENNVNGTYIIASAAIKYSVSNFTFVSTDKAVNPTSVMGAGKRLGELICRAYGQKQTKTSFSIVRFGNVLGSSGSILPLLKKQIADGGPLTVTHKDVTRYFMTIREASQLVIQAGGLDREVNTYVLHMGKPVKILNLAKNLAKAEGYVPVLKGKEKGYPKEIIIEFIGLRPGEKMHEKLSYAGQLKKTSHSKIMLASEAKISTEKTLKDILHLIALAQNGDIQKVLDQLMSDQLLCQKPD